MSVLNINPLNCAYSVGLNAFGTFSESEYASSTTRSVMFKEPFKSWFKLKTVSSAAYLEPVIFGLNQGDRIKIEFDMCSITKGSKIELQIIRVEESGTTTYIQSVKTDEQKESYFKHYVLDFSLKPEAKNNKGIIFNLRSTVLNSETILKNLNISLENESIDFKENLQVVDCKNRFEKIIKNSDLSEVRQYTNLKTIPYTFDTNSNIVFNTSNSGFKGIFLEVGNSTLRTSKAVYVKGTLNSGSIDVINAQYNKNNVLKNTTTTVNITEPTFEKIIYFATLTNVEYDYLDVGTTGNANFALEKVIFFKNRYDDDKDFVYSKMLDRK